MSSLTTLFRLEDGDVMNSNAVKVAYTDAKDNMVFIVEPCLVDLSKISFRGEKNHIYIGLGSDVENFTFTIRGAENKIYIGANTHLIGKVNIRGKQSAFKVGDSTTFQSVSAYLSEGCSVFIGEDCMFSARIEIRTSDSHTIFDQNTLKRINKPGDITIGNHVWVGKDVIISKNVHVASNIVIGVKSFVNKDALEEGCIYAGSPAKVVKRNIGWCRELMPFED